MIKVDIKPKEPEKESWIYPCIKRWNSMIVLFTAPKCGVVLESSFGTGYYRDDFSEKEYKPFHGSITLTQE